MRRHPYRSLHGQKGFTLIELVVAIALLALMTLMTYRGFDSMLRASDQVQSESERWQAVSMFFERLGADVGQATRRPVRAGDGTLLPEWLGHPPGATSEAAVDDRINAQVEFTRKSPPGSDDVRLGYRLRNNRVELMIWRVLDRAPGSTADIHPLFEGVKTLRFRYLDVAGKWNDSWPPADKQQVLPRALAVELTLGDDAAMQRVFALP